MSKESLEQFLSTVIDKDTVLIFLKGKKVKNEIHEAKKIWSFNSEIYPSQSDERGSVLIVKNLKLKI